MTASGLARFGWTTMAVLAGAIAIYAGLVLMAGIGPPLVSTLRATTPWALRIHLFGGILALALGPWQFNTRLRTRAVVVHRWMGRGYVAGVFASGTAGAVLAPRSQEGFVTHVGFGLLAALWLLTTLRAYVAIRGLDLASHRRWMIRSFALTLAAVTLRVWLPLEMVAGLAFRDAYQVVAWLCWVPNLVVAEWLVIPRQERAPLA